MTTRNLVLAEAETWLRTPYHHMGRIKGAGVDCATLLLEVFHAVGIIPKIDVGYYPQDWHFHRDEERYLGWISQYARRTETPRPGDIALFKFGRCVSHGAIVTDWPGVIHSYFQLGCVYGNANDRELAGRLDSFWTLFEE
ncbi:C40 family peptidase [Herbaspirillum sp. RV1423]|uniref:C40 family peptidase n=1 Tax=Herbaspirillum sp. RV1423 TaxID=1443993 RepID=UPI0005552D4C|nr:C40 family peptidase [Herbaspirillum sp. RV1423]